MSIVFFKYGRLLHYPITAKTGYLPILFGKNRVFTYFSSSAFYVSKTTSQLKKKYSLFSLALHVSI